MEALLRYAHALAAEGEALPVKLDKECRQLCESSQLYCLCRSSYDDELPMLACDYCGEWFHYDCVGMTAGG